MTSFDVIRELKRSLVKGGWYQKPSQISIGHTGTLDPFASGLLIVCLENSLSLARYLLHASKAYTATVRFGENTDSADRTGKTLLDQQPLPESREAIQVKAREFETQEYLQLPPMTSALKKDGVRLYELARQGKEVERQTRRAQISAFEILDYQKPDATFSVTVSGGTYIRTLAEDLAKKLSTVAHLRTLRRDRILGFDVREAKSLLDWQNYFESSGEAIETQNAFVSQDRLVAHLPSIEVTQSDAHELFCGKQQYAQILGIKANPKPTAEDRLALYLENHIIGVLVAKTQDDSDVVPIWKIERMLSQSSSSSGS